MTDDVRITIALICGAILFVYLFFSVFLEGKTKGNKLMIKAKKDGSTTIGRVVKNDYRRFTGPEGRYEFRTVLIDVIDKTAKALNNTIVSFKKADENISYRG